MTIGNMGYVGFIRGTDYPLPVFPVEPVDPVDEHRPGIDYLVGDYFKAVNGYGYAQTIPRVADNPTPQVGEYGEYSSMYLIESEYPYQLCVNRVKVFDLERETDEVLNSVPFTESHKRGIEAYTSMPSGFAHEGFDFYA
jgi:hypothetical protein